MLDEHELAIWYGRLGLSEPAQSLIRRIRSSAPARRVGGGRSNVCGRYPSRKMGFTIQFESHRVELPAIYEMEHDSDLFEFYDQPPAIKLVCECADGKRRGFLHTPDFFVLRRDSAGWEEWKTEERLRQLSAHNPKRFVQERNGWRSPPAENYAREFGLVYRLRSSNEIDWVFQRNVLLLEDYFRADPRHLSSVARENVLAHVSTCPGMCVDQLATRCAAVTSVDDIYLLIASDQVYVDLHVALLTQPDQVRVFASRELAQHQPEAKQPNLTHPDSAPHSIHPGSPVIWDGRDWQVANLGEKCASGWPGFHEPSY